jgi:hypothetical protein
VIFLGRFFFCLFLGSSFATHLSARSCPRLSCFTKPSQRHDVHHPSEPTRTPVHADPIQPLCAEHTQTRSTTYNAAQTAHSLPPTRHRINTSLSLPIHKHTLQLSCTTLSRVVLCTHLPPAIGKVVRFVSTSRRPAPSTSYWISYNHVRADVLSRDP